MDQFNFKGFNAYLLTPAGGRRSNPAAKAITSDLMMFFNTTPQSGSDAYKVDTIFEQNNVESYIHHIKTTKNYKPTTVAEKIRRLKLAIEYIMVLYSSDTYVTKGKVMLTLLTTWCHSLSQDISRQRMEITKYVRTYVDKVHQILSYRCSYNCHSIFSLIG